MPGLGVRVWEGLIFMTNCGLRDKGILNRTEGVGWTIGLAGRLPFVPDIVVWLGLPALLCPLPSQS